MRVSSAALCVTCGGPLPGGAAFCPRCGTPVSGPSAVNPPQPPASPPPFTPGTGPGASSGPAGGPPGFAPPFTPSAPLGPVVPPPPGSASKPPAGSPLRTVLLIAVVSLAVILGAGGAAWWWIGKPDRDYLAELRSTGDLASFASEAEAIAHGKKFCANLAAGSKAQGSRADLAATKSYCSTFTPGFRVLETKLIMGTFTLVDTSYSPYYTSIDTSNGGCEGAGGYRDIRSGTAVTVKNGNGSFLGSTVLSVGSGTSTSCEFSFGVSLTEGEDDYVVTVSQRGEVHYSWEKLASGGIHLTLGS